jgi:hypothetical protein
MTFERYPMKANSQLNMLDYKLTADKVALDLIPEDVRDQCHGQLPINVLGDGNCLARSASVLVFGNEDGHEEIRARIVVELATNEDMYTDNKFLNRGMEFPGKEAEHLNTTYTTFSEHYTQEHVTPEVMRSIFEKEVMEMTRRNSYMGIWQLMALSTVLNCKIQSIYPSVGWPVPVLLNNRIILPAHDAAAAGTVKILWTSTRGDMRDEHWNPNHFVPIVPISPNRDDLPQISLDNGIGDMSELGQSFSLSDIASADGLLQMIDAALLDPDDLVSLFECDDGPTAPNPNASLPLLDPNDSLLQLYPNASPSKSDANTCAPKSDLTSSVGAETVGTETVGAETVAAETVGAETPVIRASGTTPDDQPASKR